MLSLFEFRRRKMFQVTATYTVVAWLVVEIITTVKEPLSLPHWSDTLVIVLLLLGAPLMLTMSWFFNVTSDGLVRDTGSVKEKSRSRFRIEWILLGLALVTVGWLLYLAETAPMHSLAVLPFDNLSPESGDDHFASGLHEEVLSRLANLGGLGVTSRTSVQQYQDTELTIPQIATELNVSAVMEGSIQFENDRVRVHAQLIDAETDEHVWAQTYERELADFFSLESEIAGEIASALHAEFSPGENESPGQLASAPLPDVAPIEPRHKPTHIDIEVRLSLLEQAIEDDPDFAMARLERASIYIQELKTPAGTKALQAQAGDIETLALADINAALTINPELGNAHAWLGVIHHCNWRSAAAGRAFKRGLVLNPNDPDVLMNHAAYLSHAGLHDRAIKQAERALVIDPYNPEIHAAVARFSMAAGHFDRAQKAFDAAGRQLPWMMPHAAILWHIRARTDEAEINLRNSEMYAMQSDSPQWPALTAYAYARLGMSDDAERFLSRFDALAKQHPVPAAARILAHLARGDKNAALDYLTRAADEKVPYEAFDLLVDIATNVFHDPVLDLPAFAAAREKLMI